MKNYNLIKNQDIKQKFVGIYVYQCQTSLIDSILQSYSIEGIQYENIENAYQFPEVITHKGEVLQIMDDDEKEERINELRQLLEDKEEENEDFLYTEEGEEIQREIEELEDLEMEPQEIFEWWLVSHYLYRQLKSNGEPVLTDGQSHWWGRTTTGQAILLDHAISVICEDMEILEGMKNEWTV